MGNKVSQSFLNQRLDGKTALITGANSGIGKATAKALYIMGARIIMAGRDMKRTEDAVIDIQKEVGTGQKVGEFCVKQLDLSSFSSIKQCAEEVIAKEDKLHFLLNNAGVMMCPKGKTEDGHEDHFGINHLGHFYFTCLLLPKIINSAPARIINVSSSAYKSGEMNWDDLNFDKRTYSPFGAYAQSKLANVLFTLELANKLKDRDVSVFSLHPGVVKTNLGRHLDETYFKGFRQITSLIFGPFFKTPDEGALTTLYCMLEAGDEFSGCYFSDCKLSENFSEGKHTEASKKLWSVSSALVKYDVDFRSF